MQPRTLGFWGLAHQLLLGREDAPVHPSLPQHPGCSLNGRGAQSVCSWEPRGFPQRGEIPGARRGRRGLSPQSLALLLPAWSDLSGAHKQQNSPSEASSPHGLSGCQLHFVACSSDSRTLVCLWSGIMAGSPGRFRCWACPPSHPRSLTTGRAGATAQGGPPSEGPPPPTRSGLQMSRGLS